jgi:hypothetical protein
MHATPLYHDSPRVVKMDENALAWGFSSPVAPPGIPAFDVDIAE